MHTMDRRPGESYLFRQEVRDGARGAKFSKKAPQSLVPLFRPYANMRNMTPQPTTLGREIRRLRTLFGTSLRGFAQSVGVSAPHLSDIERDRRRPSRDLLEVIARALQPVGATHAGLDRLDARFESDLQEWAAETPEVRILLRRIKDSGRPVPEILKLVEKLL